MPAEVVEFGPFPEPDIGYGEEVCSLSTSVMAQTVSSLMWNRMPITPDAFRPTILTVSSWKRRLYPKRVDEDDFPGVVCHDDVDKLVSFLEPDRVRPGRPGVRELGLPGS